MANSPYKIELGIQLDTTDLQQQVNAAGDKITPIDIKVDAETKELTKTINDALKKLSGDKNAFKIDTTKVEDSLGRLEKLIEGVKLSLGALDDKAGTKNLVTSVNQIARALEKATDESNGLVASLNALSKKDFSVNIGVKSGSNPASRNALYGDRVKEIFPQLQQQKDAIISHIQKYYEDIYAAEIQARKSASKKSLTNKGAKTHSADPLSIISDLTGVDINKAWELFEKTSAPLKTVGKNKDNYRDRMNEINDLINSLVKGAEAKGIDLSSVVSEFSTSSNELVKSANDIQTGAKETEESFDRLKNVLGGGIGAEQLSAQIQPIIDDLHLIQQAITDLSKDTSLGGLTSSFNRLSESIENLLANAEKVKGVLNSGFDGGNVGGTSTSIDTSAINKIEKASDDATAAVVQNEKKKQEAYKATTDTVLYHAGVVSKLNKAETNGRFYGSNRGTGYFGTGHYFVDSATKHELDNNGYYSKMPYTSVDISQYDNLFKATTDEVADRLHTFLANLTSFTQGSDNYDVSELFAQFKSVFGDTIMDVKEFGSRLDQLKAFMSNSSLDDRSDSVSTQFMKSLGYGGVDTRGTRFADTRYGTVIYDLKEESILQANITDELQKQGQMLEKINYAKGQVFDKDTDARIQNELDAQAKKREIANEFKNSFDTSGFDKADADLTAAQNRLREIDEIIQSCQYSINNADQEAKKFARDMENIGLGYTDDEVEDYKRRFTESYQSTIDELSQEKAELQSKIPILEEAYNRESQLANEAYKQAEQTVEQRRREAQQAQEAANAVVQAEERKQQAHRETADEVKKAANSSLSKEADKITKKLTGSDLGASKYDNEIDNVTTKFNKLSNQSDQLKSDMQSLNAAFDNIKAANAANDVESLVNANREYEQVLTRVKNQIDINARAEKEASAIAKKEASEKAKAEKEAAAIANKMQKEADAAALKQTNEELKKLETTARKIGQLDFKIVKSDYNDEIELVREFERQLELLKTQYNETAKTLSSKGIDIGSITTPEFVEARNKIAEFDAQIETTKRKLAEKLQLKLDSGDFATQVLKIESDAKKLSGTYDGVEKGIKEVNAALNMMQTASTDGDIERLIDANNKYESALKKVENQLKQNKIAEQNVAAQQKLNDDIGLFQSKIDSWLTKNSAAAKQFGSTMLDLQARAEGCDRTTLNHLEAEFKQVDRAAEAAGKKTQTVGDSLKAQFSKYSTYFGVAELFMWVEQGLRDMFEQVKLIDSAMTELKKVTDETDASYNRFLTNAASRAQEIGTTIDGLVSSTADFARLGYGFEDAQGLAEVANIYAVVGDEIEGVEGATESLISTMAAFKDQMNGMSNADFAMSIIDVYNEIGKLIA